MAKFMHPWMLAIISDCRGKGSKSGSTKLLSCRISTTAQLFFLPYESVLQMTNTRKLKGVRSVMYSRRPYLCILSNVLSTIYQTLLPNRQICDLIAKTFDFQPGFSGIVIYYSGSIWTKPGNSQIVGYSATKLAICLTAATSLYILTPLSSTISKERLIGRREKLLLRLKGWYDKGGKVVASRADWVLMRKQLLYTILIRWPSLWWQGMQSVLLEAFLTRIFEVWWLTICINSVRFAWVAG